MKIKIWGARGSIPSPIKPEQVEEKICQAIYGMPEIDTGDLEAVRAYVRGLPVLERGTAGGNTTCVQIQSRGETFIIDAGSGIRELGLELMNGPCGQGQGKLHLFFSHAHWDHIQGFPFFLPAFIPGNEIYIYSVHNLEIVLHDQQRPINFPVQVSHMQASLNFVSLQVGHPLQIGSTRINTIENLHPGRAYSFRFEDEHSSFVQASDAEYKDLNDASVQPYIEFFEGADALIFDAQYTLKESWEKADWGHSSAMIGVDLARAAGVKRLILFHHDPTYSDLMLQDIQSTAVAYQAQDKTRPTCEILVGSEGLTLDLASPDAVKLQLMPGQDAAVVTPASIFDERGVDQLVWQLSQLVAQKTPADSVIDLSHVETLTTATLKMLISLKEQQESGSIVLAGPSESVMRVIELAGYSDFFAIYPSVEAALSALQASRALNLPGQMIKSRYRVEQKIGTSRLGTLLKATDKELNRTVAVKILSSALSQKTVDKFMRQTRQLIELNQENIVRIFDADKDGGIAFIVEEYVDDETLQDFLLRQAVPLPVDEALDIALDVTLALEYIHSRGLTHGNLKPKNIFLTSNGVKLSGIGSGRLEEGRNLLEAPSLHLNTAYLAPEQILGQSLDARTDLYALGIVLYQLFTGRLPFEGTDEGVMHAHLHQAPAPPREFNPKISPSLEHLILKLLVNNPSARYSSAEQARRVSSSLVVNPGDGRHQRRLPLVDREKPLRGLQMLWQQARAGRGRLAFITGEPGIGKTRLAQQVALMIKPPILLIGRCQESGSSRMYHPITEALRTYLAIVPPELFDEEARSLISNFSRLIPEINQILPDLPKPPMLEPKQEQLRLMSNLTQFIRRATQERPWLLILDDLHWTDQSSLELLRYIGHHLPTMALMIIGNYREDVLDRGHPLLELLRELSSYPSYRTYPLERLEFEGVAKLLESIWKQPAPAALTEKIYEQTAGNPFYVEEIAKSLVDDGLIIAQGGEWHFPDLDDVRLPRSVREAVWRRIHYLSPDTQTLLRQAAVLGQTFRFVDLREMSGLSEWELLEHLDIALERQLLWEEPSPRETLLRFSHAEVRNVLYDDMGPLRRRMLHRQAGEALEQYALPDSGHIVEDLAYHFCQADEFDKALVYTVQAARQAQADHANETALHWYHRTLEMLDQLTPNEVESFQRMRLSVHEYLGEMLTLVGRYDEALRHFDLARNLIEAGDSSEDKARQLAKLCCFTAEVHEKRSEYELAFEWLKKGFDHLRDDRLNSETARLYLIGAQTFDHQGKLDLAIEWCQRSLIIASQLKTREGLQTMAQAYTRLSAICLLRGAYDLVRHFCRESIEIYQDIGDLAGQVGAYNYLGAAFFDQSEWTSAYQAYTKSLTIAEKIGDVDGYGRVSSNLAHFYYGVGEWDRALDLLEQNCAMWRQIGRAKDEAKALSRLAYVHIHRKNLSEAEACLKRGQEIFIKVGSDDYMPELERRWGEYFLTIANFDEALAHSHRSIELSKQLMSPLEEGRSYRMLGQVHLARREFDLATTALQHSLSILSELDASYESARTKLTLAQLALDTGQIKEAQICLKSIIQLFESLKANPYLAEAQALQQRLHRPTRQAK